MSSIFNLRELYQRQFGSTPKVFESPNANAAGSNSPDKVLFPQNDIDFKKTSTLGTPLYEKIASDPLGREFFLPITLGGLKLPFAVMRVTNKKTIVETPMVNRKGAVIELINVENYAFKVRGFLMTTDGSFPDEQITELKDLFEVNESVVMRSGLSDIFLTAEDKVVIKTLDFPENRGVIAVKPFEIDIISDTEFSLIVE